MGVKREIEKIEYDSDINFFCVKDIKNKNYKVYITIPNTDDINDLIDLFNDLIKDLSWGGLYGKS